MTEAEKVKAIIEKDIEEVTARSISALKEQIARDLHAAIERINNIYKSACIALQKLEITDATLLDFFEKTQGNIRIYENVAGHNQKIRLESYGQQLGYDDHGNVVIDPIELRQNKKYKIILMAMEENK